jgi:hypothetical protein
MSSPRPADKEREVRNSEEEEDSNKKGSLRHRAVRKGSSFSLPGRKNSTRRRADSTATERGAETSDHENDNEKDKDKEAKADKRRSMGWNMSWGKSGKGKDKFANLRAGSDDDAPASDDDDTRSHKSSRSNKSSGTKTQKSRQSPGPARPMSRGSSRTNIREIASASPKLGTSSKRVVAMHDYTARADDEMSFTAGEEIAVLQEVSDEWWSGLLRGTQGLFPVAYVRVLPAGSLTPALPTRPPAPPPASSSARNADKDKDKDDEGYAGDTSRFISHRDNRDSRYSESEDSDHPFGDHYLVTAQSPNAYGYGYAGARSPGYDADSMASAASDVESMDDEAPVLGRRPSSPQLQDRDKKNGTLGTAGSWKATPMMQAEGGSGGRGVGGRPILPARTMSAKKAPPPPPPRRPSSAALSLSSASASSLSASGAPPIPSRMAASRTGSAVGQGLGASVGRKSEVTESPFD